MKRIGVLFGGRSGEHDVSLCSAASVVSHLDRQKYDVTAIGIDRDGKWYVQDAPVIVDDPDFGRVMKLEKKGEWRLNHFEKNNELVLTNQENGKEVSVDILFPVVHGTYCEDGTLQGLLQLAMVPFVGADAVGSAIGMDKDVAKRLLRDGGVPVVPWRTLELEEWKGNRDKIHGELKKKFKLPFFVKPCNAGSSVGVVKVKSEDELDTALETAFRFDTRVLVEDGKDIREIECAVLGNENPEASILGEVIPRHEFYSYEAKYIDDTGADLVIPAELPDELTEKLRTAAVTSYKLLNCSGMARVDFFIAKEDSSYYLNEINTLPGFTSISMYPKLWGYTGLPYEKLLDRLIDLAIDRHEKKMNIDTELSNV